MDPDTDQSQSSSTGDGIVTPSSGWSSVGQADEGNNAPRAGSSQQPSSNGYRNNLPQRGQPQGVMPALGGSINQQLPYVSGESYSFPSGTSTSSNPRQTGAGASSLAQRQPPHALNAKAQPTAGNKKPLVKPLWADWERISLRLNGLPRDTTTLDLWSIFRRHGELVSIEIFEGRTGERDGGGRIHFAPPPSKQFWDDVMVVDIQGQEAKIRVELQRERKTFPIRGSSGVLHPPILTLTMDAIQFGVLAHENEMMPFKTIKNSMNSGFSLVADLRSKRLEVTFTCKIDDPRRENPRLQHPSPIGQMENFQEYRAHIPFTRLKKMVFIDGDEKGWGLLIPLPSPPIFYVKHDEAGSHSSSKSSWYIRDAWDRTVDITYDTTWFKYEPVSLPRANQFIDIGRWTTYRLIFSKSALPTWEKMKAALVDFNIMIDHTTLKEFSTVAARVPDCWDQLELQEADSSKTNNLALLANEEDIELPYDVRYQLEVCISQGFLHEVDITAGFLQKLKNLSRDRTQRRDGARDLLSYVSRPRIGIRPEDRDKLDEKRIYDPMSLFEDKKAMSHYPEISLPEHCQWVRKVVVTPSTIYLSSPTAEPSNRVLRQYANLADRFLRVQFTDELMKGRILPAPDSATDNALFNRVHRTLQNGIRIGGRHFQYLASGNSQFRENGAWFFCPVDFLTCDNIRNWMGDVNHIKIVAKYAARLGQCFSTTMIPKSSPIGQTIKHIEDIEHNGWCFTDGVGKIAPSRARYLIQNLNMNKSDTAIPSVFQFRLGGSKGILVQWPEVPFNEVHLRPSQNKFTAMSRGLEIIKTSRYSVATLNRQTIMILSCLGVPDFVFIDLLKKQVENYELAMDDPQTAMQTLGKYVDQNGITTTIARMIADGFMHAKEPFFMTILQVWRAWSLRLLREKARIVVDKGAFVFGCADETRTLRGHSDKTKPGNRDVNLLPQIFLQVPKTDAKSGEEGEYTIITGICVFGRNPSLHPGDIRVVEAVDVPALRHLRDVVVLPTVGDRDIPSMCSGGDLDGDDYFVIWDPRLIPEEWNHPSMKHDTLKPMELTRDVKVTDLISFFVRYMKNDALSTIAHAHMAKCDALSDGPKDPQCVELAALHSNAVDYPKTGLEAYLKPSLRPKQFPHFMEKPPYKTYHSNKILGKLYDQVAKINFKPQLGGAFDERILRRYVLEGETLKTVRMIKRQHDKAMRQIMNQYDIGTEFEVWSTFVLSKPRVGTEYKRQESMEPVMINHRERFRMACIKMAGSRDPKVLYPVIAAAYLVTWEEVQTVLAKVRGEGRERELTADEMPFISFPWIFDYELGRIANTKGAFELEEIPKPTMTSLDDDVSNDNEEFQRLVGAGVIEGDNVVFGNGHAFEGQLPLFANATQTTNVVEEQGVVEEVVELEEDEENGKTWSACAGGGPHRVPRYVPQPYGGRGLILKRKSVGKGGKGTPRHKQKRNVARSANDDKKLQATLKKLNTQPIQAIEEVNMFKSDGNVIHFSAPKAIKVQTRRSLANIALVHAAVPANTFAIYGAGEDKELTELVPGILNQLGPDSLASLRKLAESYQSMSKENKEADDDDIPDLVAGENFESKVE
ncbi:RdRP-domain-containing protein [Hypoxylon sp. NC0597]|nr:RdRP-domain-containing protein [Hypoxylon sp. NC0597]